jgi:transposase
VRWSKSVPVEFAERRKTRRQIGAIVGLTGSPYRSGSVDHEQGISKAGNRRMRAMARKLLVTLWRYLESGVPPEGAELVDWRSKLHYTVSLA